MTAEKSINVLKWILNNIDGLHYVETGVGEDYNAKLDAFYKAFEALEKQMPKKPLYANSCIERKCPVCGLLLNWIGYPCRCGQMIDWSEVE